MPFFMTSRVKLCHIYFIQLIKNLVYFKQYKCKTIYKKKYIYLIFLKLLLLFFSQGYYRISKQRKQINYIYVFLNHLRLATKISESDIPLQELEEGLPSGPYLLVRHSFQKLFPLWESVHFSFSCCQMKCDKNQPTVK